MFKSTILAVGCVLFSATALADDWNKKTIVTIREPILVPGATLQPGTYVFKLVDSLANRNIVRIMNEAEDEVIATFIAIPNYRLEATDKTNIQLWETPRGNPMALRAWFYPGDNFGQEIAYPKDLAIKIAATVDRPVLETTAKSEPELREAPVKVIEKSGVETAVEVIKPVEPTPEPVAIPVPVTPPVNEEPAPELPGTASPVLAIGISGLLAIGVGLGLRSIDRATRRR